MSQQKSFSSESKFWATEYFPRGIGRSGHFTNEQAKLLEDHGRSYYALSTGKVNPINDEEANFVAVFKGNRDPVTAHEKVWKRFLDVTDQKNKVHYSVSSSSSPSVDFSDPVEGDET
jgi:uncharacterized protein YifE (UPF0438 family)